MSEAILYWMLVGFGFYVGVAMARLDTYSRATPWAILRGLTLGVPLWPVAIVLMAIQWKEEHAKPVILPEGDK